MNKINKTYIYIYIYIYTQPKCTNRIHQKKKKNVLIEIDGHRDQRDLCFLLYCTT